VIEVTAPAPVGSVEDLLDFIRDQDALAFYEKTHISELRPGARIDLTLPGQYEKLLEHIATHQWYLGIEHKREVPYSEAVASWYDRIYLPTIEAVRATGALHDFPHRTEADLYLWVTEHHWYLHQAALPKGHDLNDLVGRDLPGPSHDAARDDDRRDPTALFAHSGPASLREDVRVVGAGTEDVLVEARQQTHGFGDRCRRQLVEIAGENVSAFAVDLDLAEPIAHGTEPRSKLPRADPAAGYPIVEVLHSRGPVRAEVGDDRDRRCLVG